MAPEALLKGKTRSKNSNLSDSQRTDHHCHRERCREKQLAHSLIELKPHQKKQHSRVQKAQTSGAEKCGLIRGVFRHCKSVSAITQACGTMAHQNGLLCDLKVTT